MCEIAMLDPSEYSTSDIKRFSMLLYQRMRSSLGVVAIYDEGDHFEYDVYKAVEPEPEELFLFIDDVKDNDVKRVIIHGRLATHGEVNEQNAHPLSIDCPECDVDYVVHNGIISRFQRDKHHHEQVGHEYNTDVDSEVIAHNYGKVPTAPDEADTSLHGNQPAFLLLDEDGVYISAGCGYELSDHAIMAKQYRQFGPPREAKNYGGIFMTPTEV